ncbi:MAG: thioredoxin family protein [bacterium]|nr:thioredoxin family protein [bacterium]
MRFHKIMVLSILCLMFSLPSVGLPAKKKITQSTEQKKLGFSTITTSTATTAYSKQTTMAIPKRLPTVLEFGRGICLPCKQMKPILDELAKEYEGKVVIRIIDIDKDPELTKKSRIRLIPTQIFYDSTGKEVYRHEGFMEKSAIIEKLKEIGVTADSK